MIHGYTGSPQEMRLIADYLNDRGFTISAPLLPGHGTRPEDLNRVKWRDWTATVERSLQDLRSRCDPVFVAGLSLGAVLTLHLAANHPELPGAVVYSPALLLTNRFARLLPIGKYFVRMIPKPPDDYTNPAARGRSWSYSQYPTFGAHEAGKLIGEVRRLLPKVAVPLLIVYSKLDQDVRPESAQIVYDRVASNDKELVMLSNSGHALTVDTEWELAAEQTLRFIEARASKNPAQQRSD